MGSLNAATTEDYDDIYIYMQEVVSPEDIQLSDNSEEEADVDVEVQDGVDSDELHVDEVVGLEENSTDDKDLINESVIETDAHLLRFSLKALVIKRLQCCDGPLMGKIRSRDPPWYLITQTIFSPE